MPAPKIMKDSGDRAIQKSTPKPDIFFKADVPVAIRMLIELDENSIGTTVLKSRVNPDQGFHIHQEYKADPSGVGGEFTFKPCWFEFGKKSCPYCAGAYGKKMQNIHEYYSSPLLQLNPEHDESDPNSRLGWQKLLLFPYTNNSPYRFLFEWVDANPEVSITDVTLLITERRTEEGKVYEIDAVEADPLPVSIKPFTLDQMRRLIARKYEPSLLTEDEDDKAAKEAERQRIMAKFKGAKPVPTNEPVPAEKAAPSRPIPVMKNQLELDDADCEYAQNRQAPSRPAGTSRAFRPAS